MSSLTFKADMKAARNLAALFDQAPEIWLDEVGVATLESQLLAEREIKEGTPVGVGGGAGLKGSIGSLDIERSAAGVSGAVATSALHAIPVEIGTRPHFPPLAPLKHWAKVKLGLSDDEAGAAAIGIQRKIGREGTEGAHMFEEGLETVTPQAVNAYQRAGERITRRLATEVRK